MLTIKDLSASKALDHKEMAAIYGGSNFSDQFAVTKGGDVNQLAVGPAVQVGVGGTATSTQVSNQVDVSNIFGGRRLF